MINIYLLPDWNRLSSHILRPSTYCPEQTTVYSVDRRQAGCSSSPLWHGTSQTPSHCRQSIVFDNLSFVLIDVLHHQYSTRPSCTAVVETAELMNRYLAVADAFKNGFQIEVFLVASHLLQLPVTSYQYKPGTESGYPFTLQIPCKSMIYKGFFFLRVLIRR